MVGSMDQPLFELEHVHLTRGGAVILPDLTISLPSGASCVAGPSGSGKSTLLRLLNRLVDPDRGTVRYRGRDVCEYDPLELRRGGGLVAQLPGPPPRPGPHHIPFGGGPGG